MLGYGTTSIPIRPRHTAVFRLFAILPRTPAPRWASYLRKPLGICCHPRLVLHGTSSVTARSYCAAEPASFAINSLLSCLLSIGFYLLFLALIPMCFLAFSTRKTLC